MKVRFKWILFAGCLCLPLFQSAGKRADTKCSAFFLVPSEGKMTQGKAIAIPMGGNSYITSETETGGVKISGKGLCNWSDTGSVISTYFRVGQTGQLVLSLAASVPSGNSTIKVSVHGKSFKVSMKGNTFKTYHAGSIAVSDTGYVKVDLHGISRTGSCFANVSDLVISGTANSSKLLFAADTNNFYWSRRGPSCHINYTNLPAGNIEYYYTEITVPNGNDPVGSYFMANGFSGGYFGIQVNSASERRVLFSVWDPSKGSTTLVSKGAGVVSNPFGGEGTGGQSYLVFNWIAGNTYKFLTRGKPDGSGNTDYSSWFFTPESGKWNYIATWKRPNTNVYLTGFHSFLENFLDYNGYLGRKALWGNQWVKPADGDWKEITSFRFGGDATARNKQRADFAGGTENGAFYLQNGGFFARYTPVGTNFTRAATGLPPAVDLTALPGR
jgi:hypothetical protein